MFEQFVWEAKLFVCVGSEHRSWRPCPPWGSSPSAAPISCGTPASSSSSRDATQAPLGHLVLLVPCGPTRHQDTRPRHRRHPRQCQDGLRPCSADGGDTGARQLQGGPQGRSSPGWHAGPACQRRSRRSGGADAKCNAGGAWRHNVNVARAEELHIDVLQSLASSAVRASPCLVSNLCNPQTQ